MGLGYALTEDFPCDETAARPSMTLRGLGIIRAKDVPADRRDPDRGAAAACAVRHQGRRRDRARADRGRGRRRAARPRRRVARRDRRCAGTHERAAESADAPGSSARTTTCTRRSRAGMPAPPRPPQGFLEILEIVWWRLDRALDLEMIRWSAMLGALEALESGTTAIIDHHSSPNAIEGSLDVIAEACAEVGVRVVCCYEVTDRNGADGAKAGLAENERFCGAGGRGPGRRARVLHACAGDARRGRAVSPTISASACTFTWPRTQTTCAPDSGSTTARRTTGCSPTACTSTARCRARSCTTHARTSTTAWATAAPRLADASRSAPTASAPTCSTSSGSRSCSPATTT